MESVLVVGVPGVGRHSLLDRLQAKQHGAHDSEAYQLKLDTKYYTADVVLRCADVTSCDQARSVGSRANQLQALVLVFDVSNRCSYDSIVQWTASNIHDCEIKLVVANKVDSLSQQQQQASTSSRPAWLEQAESWCYENGFEYIEAAAGQPSIDAMLQHDGDQQGVARVLAALEAHMWPNIVQKQWNTNGQSHPAAAAAAAKPTTGKATGAGDMASNSSSSSTTQRDQGQPTIIAAAAAESDSREHHGQQQQQQQQHAQEPQDAVPTHQQQQQHAGSPAERSQSSSTPAQVAAAGSSSRSTQAAAVGTSLRDDDDDDPFLDADLDADLDDFEKLLRQVAGIRARLSMLPDADRREAAADLALKLSRMMGLGDNQDDEDDADDIDV